MTTDEKHAWLEDRFWEVRQGLIENEEQTMLLRDAIEETYSAVERVSEKLDAVCDQLQSDMNWHGSKIFDSLSGVAFDVRIIHHFSAGGTVEELMDGTGRTHNPD